MISFYAVGGIKNVFSATNVNNVDKTMKTAIKNEFQLVIISFSFVVFVESVIIRLNALTYEHPPKRPTTTIVPQSAPGGMK